MDDWVRGVSLAVLAAILAIAVPGLVRRWRRRKGPIRANLSLAGFEPYSDPQDFLIPEGGPAPTESPNRWSDFRAGKEWDRKNGVPLGEQNVRLTLQGITDSPVIVQSVSPVVLKRLPALAGWYEAPQHGGEVDVRRLFIDLDDQDPRALLLGDTEPNVVGLLGAYSFKVSDVDPEVFECIAFTTSSYVEWGIDILYVADGKSGVLPVRDDRLRVTAEDPQTQQPLDAKPDGTWLPNESARGFGGRGAAHWRALPRKP